MEKALFIQEKKIRKFPPPTLDILNDTYLRILQSTTKRKFSKFQRENTVNKEYSIRRVILRG